MVEFIKTKKGSTSIIICLLLPIMIAFLGLCVDGSYILYNRARLMTATKYAVISATNFYTIEDGTVKLKQDEARAAVEKVLKSNYNAATIVDIKIEGNKCSIESKVDLQLFFLKIVGINKKTLTENYSASRNISP